jgi:hypothetical protein
MLDLYAKPGYKMKLRERIKWWFRRRKYARQRARWGFSEYDVWDLDAYLANLLRDMTAYLAKHHMSHPYYITPEEWQQTLINISECFAQYNRDLPTPAYDAYCAATTRTKNEDGSITVEAPEDLLQAWREETLAQYNYKMETLKEGFDLLYKYYPSLWD